MIVSSNSIAISRELLDAGVEQAKCFLADAIVKHSRPMPPVEILEEVQP